MGAQTTLLTHMRIAKEAPTGANRIQAYRDSIITVNATPYSNAIILTPGAIAPLLSLSTIAQLDESHAASALATAADVVLLGTGARQTRPALAWTQIFALKGVGLEFMSTAAACRTYNVLASESRNVCALLIP